MFVVGITGGVGSGKTTASNVLGQFGAAIIDTDVISRNLTLPGGRALPLIARSFGEDFIDTGGRLDRERLRGLVFASADARRRLEDILHPLIADEVKDRLEESRVTLASSLAFLVVPLLVETKRWLHIVDRVLVIDASTETQVRRASARPGVTDKGARDIVAAQASRLERLALADDVVINDEDDMPNVTIQLRLLYQRYLRTSLA